jgi:lipoprotein NlpD
VFGASKNCGLLLLVILQVGCLNNARFTSLEPNNIVEPTVGIQSEIKPKLSVANPTHYLVKPGDTLYSIAFRFGFDYKKLAQANNIDQSYKIYEGQSLVLKEVEILVKPTQISKNTVKKDNSNSTVNSVTKVNSQENGSRSTGNTEPESRNISWSWPHNGNIVRTFLSGVSDRKGIDLRGRIGDSVLAATNGVVVYAGNGLPGYGNLIILEHPNSLLSAYAFTQEMLVKEKDRVKSGQKIATMGKQGDQPGLHFEIRQNGKPVDPLRFLPRR